jgi:leucyl-tRNA synthetase
MVFMEYNFRDIEKKWQEHWKRTNAYKTAENFQKPKCYVLDMFPYPSGAGLHVGHPLGYIASDIYSRYKRLNGFNVLHPMGYDAFGLPAEQYAMEHGIHPSVSTAGNIENFRKQLDNIGFCFDWDRTVNTSSPDYYKWTQWIFLELFNSFYNKKKNKAEKIESLADAFSKQGSHTDLVHANRIFSAAEWNQFAADEQQNELMNYRLAFCGYGEVNWCEALGTVLANDEVINGVSERGGHPVEKKKLRQWYLRITEYADRLLEGLQTVDFSEAMKEMQSNWIGKSQGAEIIFDLRAGLPANGEDGEARIPFLKNAESQRKLTVYTTRPDTIFGVDFMVIAPEHALVEQITTASQQEAMANYIEFVQSRSERERMAEKKITGCFTGAYALNPFNQRPIPVWISEYVLAGYGTGAIMAVPCGDERDFKFARHFNIPITNIIGSAFNGLEANPTKDAILENSDFLNGLQMRDAIETVLNKLETTGVGKRKINYRMRDAAFSRQRYWGEPFPVKWKNGTAHATDASELPVLLPHLAEIKPGKDGQGPLATIPEWVQLGWETNTMPGYAGSSWYFLRYMDPHNNTRFCDRKISDYWNQVDVYVGGTEHAVGHLLYSRMWTKLLFDLGHIGFDEPFKKLLNQGMIQGSSRLVYRIRNTNRFVSFGMKEQYETDALYVDVNIVDGLELDMEAFKKWKPEYNHAAFILEDGKYICGALVEKMSKRLFNTVNPDILVNRYGADTFRMYEMFLGPVEMSKPWDAKGIEGVHRFVKKLWRLFFDEIKGAVFTEETATDAELKTLHKTIKKIADDTEKFSFNTAISALMIAVNEFTELKCHKKEILEPLVILLTAYAPHIAEELYAALGNKTPVLDAKFPEFNAALLAESTKEYPVSINGKLRTAIRLALDLDLQAVEKAVLDNEVVQKWLEHKSPKKIVFVKGKMINVVV